MHRNQSVVLAFRFRWPSAHSRYSHERPGKGICFFRMMFLMVFSEIPDLLVRHMKHILIAQKPSHVIQYVIDETKVVDYDFISGNIARACRKTIPSTVRVSLPS